MQVFEVPVLYVRTLVAYPSAAVFFWYWGYMYEIGYIPNMYNNKNIVSLYSQCICYLFTVSYIPYNVIMVIKLIQNLSHILYISIYFYFWIPSYGIARLFCGRGPAQDVPFFYTRYHLSEIPRWKSIISTYFLFVFIFKWCTTHFSRWIVPWANLLWILFYGFIENWFAIFSLLILLIFSIIYIFIFIH